MPDTALARLSEDSIRVMRWQAQVLLKSEFFPKHFTKETQVLAVMMMADELGVGRMTAIRNMYVVDGKPTCNSQLMLALCRRTGEMEDFHIEGDDRRAVCMMKRKGQTPQTLDFTFEEAEKLGITAYYDRKSGTRKRQRTWDTQPATMLRWKAVAKVARLVFPDAIEGLYMHDELGVPVRVTDEDDVVVDENLILDPDQSLPEQEPKVEAPEKPKPIEVKAKRKGGAKVAKTVLGGEAPTPSKWTKAQADEYLHERQRSYPNGEVILKPEEWTQIRAALAENQTYEFWQARLVALGKELDERERAWHEVEDYR